MRTPTVHQQWALYLMGSIPHGLYTPWAPYPMGSIPHGLYTSWALYLMGSIPHGALYPMGSISHGLYTPWARLPMGSLPPYRGSTWQSNRSVMPPCPGMVSPKSLSSNALFKPLAKKPPAITYRVSSEQKDASKCMCRSGPNRLTKRRYERRKA